MDISEIKSTVQGWQGELVALRREFHRFPELSGHEAETAGRIAKYLTDLGLDVQTGIAGHGVTAVVRGAAPGKTALVRSDMDALPVSEQSGVEFQSEHPGTMHACGHDMHMTIALGTARLLQANRAQLRGVVKFVFQPSEEVPPGGAKPMIEAGVLREPAVDGAFALHVFPEIPVGVVGVRDGVLLSQADDFDLEVIGAGGHGALPHRGADALAAACEIVSALQVAASRKLDPIIPTVISIGRITGGAQRNVLCDRVVIEGTSRAADPATAAAFPELIESVAEGVGRMLGVETKLTYMPGYPPLDNSVQINAHFRRAIKSLWGAERLLEIPVPLLAGEDFAYFAQAVPGAMIALGVGDPEAGPAYPLHHPRFMASEGALAVGVATMAAAVADFCADAT